MRDGTTNGECSEVSLGHAPEQEDLYRSAIRALLRVATRELGTMTSGYQTVRFNGRDQAGNLLPSGVYFYRVTAGGGTTTRKMVIRR